MLLRRPGAGIAQQIEIWTGADAEDRFRDTPLPLPLMQGVFAALGQRLRTIRPGDEVISGVRSIPSPGHTSGHICLGVETGAQPLLLTGDAIATINVAFERPDWQNLFDEDPELAGRTRRQLLDRTATDEMLILGYHFPFPGLGFALRDGEAYRWYPAAWLTMP